MRSNLLYGVILFCCFIVATVQADKKWKVYETEDDKIRKKDDDITLKKLEKVRTNKNKNFKFVNAESSEESDEKSVNKVETDQSKKGKGKKPGKQVNESFLGEDTSSFKRDKNEDKKVMDPPPPQKRFIGRIEHGKVMVLRIKEDNNKNNSDTNEEDHKAKVCRKTKSGKKMDCDNSDAEDHDESNEDNDNKSKKKIKYSIKFQHEKQKKKENSGDIGIMRMHKNGKRYGQHDDDDDDVDNSSHEDDSPIKKRISYDDDD